MKISIITINCNNREGLRHTIESVAAQKHHLDPADEIQHIIVDGCSTDGSVDVIDTCNVAKVVSNAPNGVYNAINAGLKYATGDIVGLLHSGDVFAAPDAVSIIAARFRADDKPDFIWGDVTKGRRYYSGKKFTPDMLLSGFTPPHPSLYMRREAVDAVGLYDESYVISGDFDYFLRLFNHPDIAGTYMPGALVDMQPGGISHKFKNVVWNNNVERLRALRKNNMPASPLRLLVHYKMVLYGYLCGKKR